jgi:ParB/RepB/Spo0J family partition protein
MARRRETAAAVVPISSLLPTPTKAVVRLDQIDPSPFNKRVFRENDPQDLELTENIRALGRILEPLLLRPERERYRLIAGERRLRCGRRAGLVEADAMVYEVDEPTANLLTFVENFHRRDLHYLEEAAAVEGLLTSGCSQEMIASQIGKPVKWVALRARLTNLSDRWRELALDPDPELAVRLWSPSHLEVIALLGKPAQDELLCAHEYLVETEPSVAQLRGIVSEMTLQLSGTPWSLDDDTLCPKAGACSTCPLRSSAHPTLFDDLDDESTSAKRSKDRCLNLSCWKEKLAAFLARREAELRQDHPDLVLLTTGSARKPGAVTAWSTRPAKKSQPGAVPALVLDGSDRGKLRWVHLPELPSAAQAAEPAAAPAAPVPGQRAKTPLPIRQAALDRRRKLLATETIATAVAASEQTPPLPTVIALACVFGTEQTLSSGSCSWDFSLPDALPPISSPDTRLPLWTLAQDLAEGDDLGALGLRLWRRIRPVLLKRTASIGTPEDILRGYGEASTLAALVGVDSAQHLKEATASLPDPHSWAAEAAAIARAAADQAEPRPVETDDAVLTSSPATESAAA